MNKVEMNDNMMELVYGGVNDHGYSTWYLDNKFLKYLGLDNIVSCTDGWTDTYYDINENGTWRNVGSADMVNFVKNTLGSNDNRYLKLKWYYDYRISKRNYW